MCSLSQRANNEKATGVFPNDCGRLVLDDVKSENGVTRLLTE